MDSGVAQVEILPVATVWMGKDAIMEGAQSKDLLIYSTMQCTLPVKKSPVPNITMTEVENMGSIQLAIGSFDFLGYRSIG